MCNIDDFLCWSDDLALQKQKLENIQPFLIAVLIIIKVCVQIKHHKHAWSIQHMNTLGTSFFIDHIRHCVMFVCNKTRTPVIKLDINVCDSKLFATLLFWF